MAAGRPGRPVSDEVMVHAVEANRTDWPLTELLSCTHTAMNVSFLCSVPSAFFFFPPLSCPQTFHTSFHDGCLSSLAADFFVRR